MRFYLDENLSDRIAALGREQGLDVVSSHEAGHKHDGRDDGLQLLVAAEDGRCLVTQNGPDFKRLTDEFPESGLAHAGVLVVPHSLTGNEFALIVERLVVWHRRYPEGTPSYFLGYL